MKLKYTFPPACGRGGAAYDLPPAPGNPLVAFWIGPEIRFASVGARVFLFARNDMSFVPLPSAILAISGGVCRRRV